MYYDRTRCFRDIQEELLMGMTDSGFAKLIARAEYCRWS